MSEVFQMVKGKIVMDHSAEEADDCSGYCLYIELDFLTLGYLK